MIESHPAGHRQPRSPTRIGRDRPRWCARAARPSWWTAVAACCMRAAAVGVGRQQPDRAAADAPAQRPHRRPGRRDHHPVGHRRSPDSPAADHRPAGNRRGRRRHAGGVRSRHRLPHRPSRRPDRAARRRGGGGAPTGVVWGRDGVRITRGPTDHRPVAPTIGFRIEHDGASVVLAGDTVPCAEPRRAGRRRGGIGAHRDPQGPHRPDARCSGSATSATTTRRWSRPPKPPPAPAWAS